ncbi:hypothetical protein MTR_8g045360 [Medicago truncatula]|uniref:Uncharacterized protein n=1 Tax=Medicago truncatula TaxID=3880 RepID=G7L7S4_MEDTR|nr:hypothetical protein MTR_8g045360 [Medicago truncatula]
MHFATLKMMDCDCPKGRRSTLATVLEMSGMLGSQQHFATVYETVASTAAIPIATVHNSRKVHFFLFERSVATVCNHRK